MNNVDFVQTSILATVLTLLVTLATCIISKVTGYRKIKIENFRLLYKCLVDLTNRRAEIIDRCNALSKELADSLPEKWNKESSSEMIKKYKSTYSGINEIIAEYSMFLDFFLSFSHFLYKDKPIIPIIKADCWSILSLHEKITAFKFEQVDYCISYSQIASLTEFIRIAGNRTDKKMLRRYMKRNKICEFASGNDS